MGFTNSTQGFHQVITKIFSDTVGVCVELIVDNVLVHLKGVEKHFEDIEEMMHQAEEAKMVFKVLKMKIAMTEIRIWS